LHIQVTTDVTVMMVALAIIGRTGIMIVRIILINIKLNSVLLWLSRCYLMSKDKSQ